MIILKKKLSFNDLVASSSEHHWRIGTYLKTNKGTFVYIKRIVIYDQNKKEEICEFPYFKDLEDKVNEIKIGFDSNAEAFIYGSNKKYILQKRRIKNFDGEVFYVGKRSYDLYIPKNFFEFLSESETVEMLPTTKKIKKAYTFRLTEYPEYTFTGHYTLETKNLIKNKEFIADFLEAFNFKGKNTGFISQDKCFTVLDNSIRKEIVTKMKTFIEKYENFEIEA